MNLFSKPPETQYNFLSLGAGVQSSTLALMAAHGEVGPVPDGAIFADTQAEPQSVYDWLTYLETAIARAPHPFPVHVVTKGSLMEASLRVRTSKKTGLNYLKHSIPAYMLRETGAKGIMGRACTLDFKITPILSAVKKLAKVRRGQKECTVTSWIGISTDEAIRMKPSREPWVQHRWPLIELEMSRKDCFAWMEAKGLPTPPRSSCSFCPYHSDAEWLRLRDQEPDAFQQAVQYEKQLQHSASQICRLDGVPYLHNSRIPLDQINFDGSTSKSHPDLFGNDCTGMCGV